MMNSRLCKVGSERYLPADLWPEILCRLPVKSLLRFRCVSKSWLSLIDDADFARLHLNNFKNNRDETHLFVVHGTQRDCAVRCSDTYETNSETLFSLGDMYSQKGGWCIVFSVDGLILLESDDRFGQFRDLKVWNPSIRKFRELPSLPEIETSPDSFMVDDGIGLGYDPLANDYKIVKLLLLNYKTLHSVAIYSLGGGSWKIIKLQGKGSSFSNWHWRRDFFFSKEIYFQGSLYFLAKDAHSHLVRDLVSFDLSREVFSSVSLPNDPKFTAYGCELGLIDGGCSLALFGSSSLGKSVWVLKGCSAESESMHWTKRCSFRLEFTQFLYIKKNGDILTRSRSREEPFTAETGNKKSVKWDQVSSYSLETSKKKSVKWDQVSSYSLETNEYKILQQKRASMYIISHVCGYVESLILHR